MSLQLSEYMIILSRNCDWEEHSLLWKHQESENIKSVSASWTLWGQLSVRTMNIFFSPLITRSITSNQISCMVWIIRKGREEQPEICSYKLIASVCWLLENHICRELKMLQGKDGECSLQQSKSLRHLPVPQLCPSEATLALGSMQDFLFSLFLWVYCLC